MFFFWGKGNALAKGKADADAIAAHVDGCQRVLLAADIARLDEAVADGREPLVLLGLCHVQPGIVLRHNLHVAGGAIRGGEEADRE